tara:strand:+ start:2279 stop:3070 length:792 start_codon:yes stop_codon:yes gene_type:complete
MQKLYRIILDHLLHNLKVLLNKKNFFFICLFKIIIIFNKKFKFKIFKIRNFYDYIAIRELFILECYDLNHLKLSANIKKFYSQIFIKNKIPLILDCGSNIGASPYYFFENYRNSKIVCLEPEIENFKLLQKNINKNNFDLISKAISSNHRNFEIEKKSDDPRSFRTIHSSKGDIESITVNKLLEKYNSQKYEPFIIKIDIEGHEKELFNENLEWIDKFKIIIIEPHDWLIPGKSIFNNFIKSISKLNRDFIILNENIVSIRNN